MKQSLNWIIALGIGCMMAAGCEAAKKPQSKPAASVASVSKPGRQPAQDGETAEDSDDEGGIPSSSGSPESLAHFAAGVSHALSDESDAALDEFYKAALADPTNEPIVIEVSRNLLAKKQPDKAIDLLTRSAARPGSSALLWCNLAQAQMECNRTNQAGASARKAIQKKPDFLDGYQTLFSIQLQSADFTGALATLDKASVRVPKAPVMLLAVAQLYAEYLHARPQADPAIKARALALVDRVATPDLPDKLAFSAAVAYERLDEPGKAANVYIKAVQANPTPGNREKLAGLYMAAGEKKKAAEELQAIVRENPARFPRVWYMLGSLAYDVKEYAGAAGFFEKAILLDPAMEQAYYDLALVQIDLKKNGDALETLALARKKFPNTFVGEYFTGVACGRLKDWSEAVRHFTEAEVIAKAGDSKQLDYQFYFQIAAAAERSHQIPQAVEYFETCLKLKPNFTEAMNYLGYMWAERGENLDHARDLIEKAVKAEPTNAAFLDSLGWVLFKQGKNAEALPWLIKARDLSDEPDATVCEHVGDVYLALGRKDKAREAFEKSLAIESNNDVKKKLDQLVAGPP